MVRKEPTLVAVAWLCLCLRFSHDLRNTTIPKRDAMIKSIFLPIALILAATFVSSYASGDVTLDENRISKGTYTGTVVAITYSASQVIEAVHFREDREGAKDWRITNKVRDERKILYGEIERFAQLFQKAFDSNLVLTMNIDADGDLETITLSKPKK